MFSWLRGTKEDRERLAAAKERIRKSKEKLRKMDRVNKIDKIVNKKKYNLVETFRSLENDGSNFLAEIKNVNLIQDAGLEKLKIEIEFLSDSKPREDKDRDDEIINVFCRELWSDPEFVQRFTELVGDNRELLLVTVSMPEKL